MAMPRIITADKLKEIEQNLYSGYGIVSACKAASVAYPTYAQARYLCEQGEFDQRLKPHFERHARIRKRMKQMMVEAAPETIYRMGIAQDDWRAVKEAAAMAREEDRADRQSDAVQDTCNKLLDQLADGTES